MPSTDAPNPTAGEPRDAAGPTPEPGPPPEPRPPPEVAEPGVTASRGRSWSSALSVAPHFLTLAPVDVWFRLLRTRDAVGRRPRVGPLYWHRVAGSVAVSLVATVLTGPERLAARLLLPKSVRSPAPTLDHDAVVITGYYRSGTTHLHYLLSGDSRFRAPRWVETLAPHGWAFTWTLLRLALIPFLPGTRPQDDVAFGPDYPAEDDFATCGYNLASPLPGRFVFPALLYGHFHRYHALRRLNERELRRWRYATCAFLWRISRLGPRRTLLLKTPSHTARVAELHRLFNGRVRFVHISRDPEAVVRSNVKMHRRLQVYNLEHPPSEAEVRRRIIAELVETDAAFERDAAALPAEAVVRLRFEDLIADPERAIREIYAGLDTPLAPSAQERFRRYLHGVRSYRTASEKGGEARTAHAVAPPATPELQALWRRGGHDRPPWQTVTPERPESQRPSDRPGRAGWAGASAAAVLCAVVWVAAAAALENRYDSAVWLVGYAVGGAALLAGRVGSRGLGVWAVAWVLAVYALQQTLGGHLAAAGRPGWRYIDTVADIARTHATPVTWVFLALAVLTAYRAASRPHLRPPGT